MNQFVRETAKAGRLSPRGQRVARKAEVLNTHIFGVGMKASIFFVEVNDGDLSTLIEPRLEAFQHSLRVF